MLAVFLFGQILQNYSLLRGINPLSCIGPAGFALHHYSILPQFCLKCSFYILHMAKYPAQNWIKAS